MADKDNTGAEESRPQRPPSRLDRIVQLARSVLKGEGLSDYQIDALLSRPRAPQRDRLGPED